MLLRDYVPGLAGAVLIVVPYAVWAWRAGSRTAGARGPSMVMVAGVAVAAIALTFAAQSMSGLLLG